MMIGFHIKIALRNLYRNRLFAVINILGLSLGLAACVYVATLVFHETGFDRFHPDHQRIHRLIVTYTMNERQETSGSAWGPVGREMEGEVSGIEMVCRVSHERALKLRLNDRTVQMEQVRYADSELLSMLGFELLRGSEESALNDPGSLVLTESEAERLFGDEEAIGQVFVTSNSQILTVTGIMADPPDNTHIPFKALLSYQTAENDPEIFIGWDGGMTFLTYLKLKEHVDPADIEEQFPAYLQHRINDKYEPGGWKYELELQPIKDIHLTSHLSADNRTNRNASYLWILSSIAFVMLILALINYINLTSALAGRRVREVTLSKVVGAGKMRIANQVIVESLVTTALASVLAIVWVKSFYRFLNQLTTSTFELADYTLFIMIMVLVLIGVFGVLAGVTPATLLARLNLVSGRQGLATGSRKQVVRNVLVVFQFFTAILLISCFLLVNRQSNYLMKTDVGYPTEEIMSLFSEKGLLPDEAQRVKDALLRIPELEVVSMASQMPGQGLTTNGYQIEGMDSYTVNNVIYTDQDFLDCFGLELTRGRNFYDQLENDKFSFMVNEAMVDFARWEEPLGKRIERNGDFEVIGVVKNFNFASLEMPVAPLVISCNPRNDSWSYYNFNIRFNTTNPQAMISKIEEVWKEHLPEVIFDYQFMDDYLKQNYVSIKQIQKIVSIFSLVAILIAIIGLFGLSTYITQTRSKEIGIRKVNGAKVTDILVLLNFNMVKWIMLAFIPAVPVALFILRSWLANYANRTNIAWWIFALAGLISILLAIFTISWESWRIARKNPVETLRHE